MPWEEALERAARLCATVLHSRETQNQRRGDESIVDVKCPVHRTEMSGVETPPLAPLLLHAGPEDRSRDESLFLELYSAIFGILAG